MKVHSSEIAHFPAAEEAAGAKENGGILVKWADGSYLYIVTTSNGRERSRYVAVFKIANPRIDHDGLSFDFI